MEMYNETNFAQAVTRIHESKHKGVLAITGGGTGAIDELLKRGGGSATLLKAVVPYSFESWQEFLGKVPEKTVTLDAARQLAVTAFHNARKLDTKSEMHFGIGSTGALAKASNEREGRKHHLHIAFQSEKYCAAVSLDFHAGNRLEQEAIASKAIVLFLSECLAPQNSSIMHEQYFTFENIQQVPMPEGVSKLLKSTQKEIHFPLEPEGETSNTGRLIFSGSFNPIHEGHLEVAAVAEAMTGLKVTYEIAVTNADKPPLDFIEIQNRTEQFKSKGIQNIALTNCPFFFEKAQFFKNSTFIVGVDTWKRIVDAKYGVDVKSLFTLFFTNQCKFLVFGRYNGEKFETLKDVILPEAVRCHDFISYGGGVIEIPEEKFRKDISSTEIRKALKR